MKFTKEIKIALVAIVGMVVLFFGMNFLKGLNVFGNDTTYYIAFKDISGVSTSCPIYAGGYKVGSVTGITYDFTGENDIMVQADLASDLRIPVGSGAAIETDLMGNVKIDLVFAEETDTYLEPGGIINGGVDNGALGELGNMVPVIENMLPKLDSIMASLNALLADPAMAGTLHNAEEITNNLTTTTAELNALMAQLNNEVPGMMTRTNAVLANVDTLTTNINGIDLAGTMAKVDATLANVESLTAKLNSSEGTLGLLMNDPALYNNMTSTMGDADSLLIDLKAHPKRYVHFSLFGKKDN